MRPPITRAAPVGAALLAMAACSRGPSPDAYGNFETTEVVVSAETSGQLLRFTPTEGATIPAGAVVAVLDTAQLTLERDQAAAQRVASESRVREVGRQIDVLSVQQRIAQRAYERTKRLYDQQAATAQQLDQAERDFRVLGQQVEATRAQRQAAAHDGAAAAARVAQIEDLVRRSRVTNPVAGTVLATYARAGEFIQPGQPLYRIANLDSMVLRAYVAETQLAHVRLGAPVQVSVDVGAGERRVLPGRVTWVSSSAEFTPTPIQTREERADLVYAVKIDVPNTGGIAKIGMPADVRFTAPPAVAGSDTP
jgi:HlyD family secretion protein